MFKKGVMVVLRKYERCVGGLIMMFSLTICRMKYGFEEMVKGVQ